MNDPASVRRASDKSLCRTLTDASALINFLSPSLANYMSSSSRFIIAASLSAVVGCSAARVQPNTSSTAASREEPVTAMSPPLASVCRLQVQRHHPLSSAGYFSSGAYIGDGLIVTAAHNLFSSTLSKVTSVGTECGVLDHVEPSERTPRVQPNRIAIWPGYSFKDYRDDTALLRVDDKSAVAFFDIAPDDFALEKGQVIALAGFPGSGYGEGQHMFIARGNIVSVDETFIRYDIETATGNSGGPLWVERDGHHWLVGVHVSGGGNVGTARRVNASRVARLKELLSSE